VQGAKESGGTSKYEDFDSTPLRLRETQLGANYKFEFLRAQTKTRSIGTNWLNAQVTAQRRIWRMLREHPQHPLGTRVSLQVNGNSCSKPIRSTPVEF